MRRALRPRAPRIGTWNIAYFPDADERQRRGQDGTHIAWLACLIGQLDVDILAVQEFKLTARSRKKQAQLIAELNRRTGGDWAIELAHCAPATVQHPGFLFDKRRVAGSHFRELPILNPRATCSNRVSPGFAGYFAIRGGPDFHLVAVHLEAYPKRRSLAGRAYSVGVMGQVARDAFALVPDQDIIFAGDFNTTGCKNCRPRLSSVQEIERLRGELARARPSFRLSRASLPCSNTRGGSLMDHFAKNTDMAELAVGAVTQVGGVCAESACTPLHTWHEAAAEHVSDHCPLTLDLLGLDDD